MTKAIKVIILIKRSNSLRKGVLPASAESAKPAIYPIMVLSPILNTIPLPLPLVHKVPKKATFLVSKIFSGSVH